MVRVFYSCTENLIFCFNYYAFSLLINQLVGYVTQLLHPRLSTRRTDLVGTVAPSTPFSLCPLPLSVGEMRSRTPLHRGIPAKTSRWLGGATDNPQHSTLATGRLFSTKFQLQSLATPHRQGLCAICRSVLFRPVPYNLLLMHTLRTLSPCFISKRKLLSYPKNEHQHFSLIINSRKYLPQHFNI